MKLNMVLSREQLIESDRLLGYSIILHLIQHHETLSHSLYNQLDFWNFLLRGNPVYKIN
jgi:hypothetical protein